MPRSRPYRIARGLSRGFVFAIAFVLILLGIGLAALQTSWGQNRLRDLIVRQANQFLTAQLDIASLDGSLLRGLQLGGIRLSRDGHTIISIERISLSYNIRELLSQGTSIRRIRLERPHVVASRQADGRWDLAALVKREERQQERTGPRRPIHILSIEVIDGTIELNDEFRFGAARVPTRFSALNTTLSFDYEPVTWRLEFADMSWVGGAPDLTVERLAGGIASGNAGLSFRDLSVRTPRSSFTLTGRVVRGAQPTVLDLHVTAERFAFQEWSGILTGLKNIAVESAFDAKLAGPLAKLTTTLDLRSNGGDARGPFVLDTTVPGWRGVGSVELTRLNLARWMNRPDRPSDITGRASFDLDLNLGRVPVGTYEFDGAHAGYLGYEGDRVRARGRIESHEVRIDEAESLAYGANVKLTAGSISFDTPYPFRFQGTATQVDLRLVPDTVPVPHVESMLTFDYDVTGQFSSAFIAGGATFRPSEFLGARIGAGATGTIDTSIRPIQYSGEGDISDINLLRFGDGLDVSWMKDPRYAGLLSGHFKVAGTVADRQTMILTGGGRLVRADLFDGSLTDADVEVRIDGGSLEATYDGRLTQVDPALALGDPRFAASLTGSGRARITVQDLLTRSPVLADYDIDASLSLADSVARGVKVQSGAIAAHLADGSLNVSSVRLTGPAVDAGGAGVIEFDGTRSSSFDYKVARADLAELSELLGRQVKGDLVTNGRLSGPVSAIQLVGEATLSRLEASGISALTASTSYDVSLPEGSAPRISGKGRASFVEAFNQSIQQVEGTVAYLDDRVEVDLSAARSDTVQGSVKGVAVVDAEQRTLDIRSLNLTFQDSAWRLASSPAPPGVSWDEDGFAISATTLVADGSGDGRIALSGTWRRDGSGALEVNASRVALDSFSRQRPARYGGLVDVIATIGGTPERPLVRADLNVTNGRIRQISYQKLIGRVDYADEALRTDLRLDQAPGVWLTVAGFVPLGAFDPKRAEQPMDLEIASSSIGLGLIEGLTTVVRNVTGTIQVNLKVVGTSRDPHFTGSVDVADAAFVVTSSGAQYKNGRAAFRLSSELVRVESFHLEDNRGRPLEFSGSLGTHELRVGDLEIDITAKGFEVLRNEFGTVDIDAQLTLRGKAEYPRLDGALTIVGGTVNVDEILDRTLFRPYSVRPSAPPSGDDAVAALNPWERFGMSVALRIPGTLRMTGDELQVTAGTPIGLGDINLRVFGELSLYKDPGDVLYVTGSLDSLTGTYSFQGRRFDIDPASSINFHGDLNPDLYVTVSRLVSGVETRVTIAGPLREPELRLASVPPLDPSDILALIVFGTSANDLSDLQQQELAVRAGTLAAGFLAAPLISALERSLGLEILEIEAPDSAETGPRVTIGDELFPGLVARFSRQFGRDEYDEATIEYSLSRLLRIRATFSDAATLNARMPFRRTERAGIDLILFFSF